MKYEWIFFDLDNTLMDFKNAARKAFSSSFVDFGLIEKQGHHDIYDDANSAVWKSFENGKIDALRLRTKRFDDFFMMANIRGVDSWEFNKIYLEYLIEYSTMLEGSIELLESLKNKVKLAIITNGLKEAQRPRIKKLGIGKYFEAIIVSDEIGISKPHKGYFDIVMETCGNPPKNKVLVIGDSLNSDMKGAINYGLDSCWCNLFGQINYSKIQPLFEINALSKLPKILSVIK
jgi:2-haloacid dehalogenase